MRIVITLGESLIDFVASVPGTIAEVPSFMKAPGGAPANVAACVARLGGQAAFVGKRGMDAFGEYLASTLQECGVDTTFFHPAEQAKTALAFVSLDTNGERSFLFYRNPSADMLLEENEVPLDFIEKAGILHVGSISLTVEPARSATIHAVREAKRRGVFISYDPNWRPALWQDTDYGIKSVKHLYEYCDLIKLNREELCLFAQTQDVKAGAEYFHRQGISLVLITLDAEGCYYSYRGTSRKRMAGRVKGVPVECIDTTGAGDSFVGAFLYQLAQSRIRDLDMIPLEEWVEFAVYTSALVTMKKGGIPALPNLVEVREFMSI